MNTDRVRPRRRTAALVLAVVVVGAGCSSSDDVGGANEGGDEMTEPTAPAAAFTGVGPDEVVRPPAEGTGINLPQPAAAPPAGYVQEEYFLDGVATSFDEIDAPDDGSWSVAPGQRAGYRTRVVVRRPANAADFSGTVLVEWFNVSAIEAAPDWGYLAGAIGREGHAYVGVSAQAQGIEGGDALLEVDVDEERAGRDAAAVDASGLKNIDAERYGTLTHPGDRYSFDIFSQAGRAVTRTPELLLGDLEPTQVIAMGESQSAMFLSTLVNAVHPLDPVFDGFLIHSRGSLIPDVDGTYVRSRQGTTAADVLQRGVRIRTDLDVPVMIIATETDLTLLGYVHARQPDTAMIRTWEIAGTAHADSETLRAVIGGPRDPAVGSFVGCGPVNSGPQKEVLRAALHHLTAWAADGAAPPAGERIEVDVDGPATVRRDDHGNAVGGIRNPLVDVPVATLTGDPVEPTSIDDVLSDICTLFGQTIPFDQATLVGLYGGADTYLERFRASAATAVAQGFMLQADAEALLLDVEPHRSRFP